MPHVLILTAIVVGISTTSLGLALIVRIREAYSTIEEYKIQEIELDLASSEFYESTQEVQKADVS